MSNVDSKIEAETSSSNLVTTVYEKMENSVSKFRKVVNRPLTISEKILIGHLDKSMNLGSEDGNGNEDALTPSKSYVLLNPDRVALQDVTGQMTILQFVQSGLKQA